MVFYKNNKKEKCGKNRLLVTIPTFIFIMSLNIIFAIFYTFAGSIGLDERGIVYFDDEYNPINNEWEILDLDFDGVYEKYYFNKDGFLQTNKTMGQFTVNEKGQQILGQSVNEIYEPQEKVNIGQIDNFDYYYIDNISRLYNERWNIDEDKDIRVTINTPIIKGIDNNIAAKINDIISNKGLELLKLYAKDRVYKLEPSKFYINIDRYNKYGIHPLNFVILDNKYYFNFTVYITKDKLDDKKKRTIQEEYTENIGLCINLLDNSCNITNRTYKNINKKNYENEDKIDEIHISIDEPYNRRYESLVNELKSDYIDSLTEYIDEADIKISEYEDDENITIDSEIRFIERYIKNIDSVYNIYEKDIKNKKKNNEIDEETYEKLLIDFKDLLDKYMDILDKNLQVNIYALKENTNNVE